MLPFVRLSMLVYSLIHYRLWPGEFQNLGEATFANSVAQRLKDETLRSCPVLLNQRAEAAFLILATVI